MLEMTCIFINFRTEMCGNTHVHKKKTPNYGWQGSPWNVHEQVHKMDATMNDEGNQIGNLNV